MTDPSIAPALLEHLADGVLACDADGLTLTFNHEAREIFGTPRESVSAAECPEHFALYMPGEDRLMDLEELPLYRALQGEQVRDCLVEVRRPRQPRRLVSASGGPVRGRGGDVLGAVVAVRDVTKQAAFDRALQARGAVADAMPVAVVVICASHGDITYANAAAERMFGYTGPELVGQPFAMLDAPITGPVERAAEVFDALEADGVWSGDVEHERKNGSRFWSAVTISPFEHPELGPVWISAHADVTLRKAAEEGARLTADRFRTVFERNPVGILLLDDDGRVRDVNPSASAITGYARDELVGRSLGELVHPEDASLVRDAAVQLYAGEIAEYEVTIRAVTKDGQIVRLAQLATAVRGPGGRAVGALAVIHPVAGDRAAAQ